MRKNFTILFGLFLLFGCEGQPQESGACSIGETLCSNGCADVESDRDNCGSCGRFCTSYQACYFGQCVGAPTHLTCGDGLWSPGEECDYGIPAGETGSCPNNTCNSGNPCLIGRMTCSFRTPCEFVLVPIGTECGPGMVCNESTECVEAEPVPCTSSLDGQSCDGADEDDCEDGVYTCRNQEVVCTDDSESHTETRYRDNDGDGFGNSTASAIVCAESPLSDGVRVAGDCDDWDSETHPGVAEQCDNGDDDDCDGAVDCADSDCAADRTCVTITACTTIETMDSAGSRRIGVAGAPRFSRADASPMGAAVPGLEEVLVVAVDVVEGCSEVSLRRLRFRVVHTDNAGSDWRPGVMRLHFQYADGVSAMVSASESLGGFFEFNLTSLAAMWSSGRFVLRLSLDTVGASSATDDMVRVDLVGPVEFVTLTDSAIYSMAAEVIGGTLVY